MSHTIEHPNPPVYVFIYNDTGFYDYTYVNTTQVFDTAQSFQQFETWTGLYEYATANGYDVPQDNPIDNE